MNEHLSPYHLPSANESAMERAMNWISCGIAEPWIERRLLPVCQSYSNHLNRGEEPGSLRALESGDSDWEILFLGHQSNQMVGGGSFESLVGRISRARALDCIVAVVPTASAELCLSLMRAGATDVLTLDADDAQIERVLRRVVDVAQVRRTQSEQDKLRLIGQLAVSVNHEINNPLTGLMGTAELLLLEDRKLSEKIRRDLQTIIKQCHRIQEVTARLKTLNHLRTVPYGAHDRMIDLIGEMHPEPASPSDSPQSDQFLPAPTILVVDDNPLIIDLIARLFEHRFTIDAAGCASEALIKIEANSYDLIVIDLILPEMNGLELFRAIRRQKPRQKAMLTTAYEGDVRVEQAIAEGALGCIYKPFQLEDLESALTDAIKPRVG